MERRNFSWKRRRGFSDLVQNLDLPADLHELISIDELEERPVPKESPLYPVFSYHLERLTDLYDTCKET